jgi:hypothetical protein
MLASPAALLRQEHVGDATTRKRYSKSGAELLCQSTYPGDRGQAQAVPETRIKDSQRSVHESLAMGIRAVYLPVGFAMIRLGLPNRAEEPS